VDKPAGLVVHPGAGHRDGTLVGGLLARFPELASVGAPARPGIVHRLDRGTSGLLVVARTPAAFDDLVTQLSARTVERRYVAVVLGVPAPRSGVVDAPIGRSPRDPTRMAVAATGRPARTHYRVEQAFEQPVVAARLACRLETGRTHQVRVHLSAIGHPVVGDARYGGDRPALPAPRPCLHAARLGFRHPSTGEEMAFEAPLPRDLEAVLAGLA
jgi:23S rRNA pseudouridine1911/1915/1917 synthase